MIFLDVNDISKTVFENLMRAAKNLILDYWWVIVLIMFVYFVYNLLKHLKLVKAIQLGVRSNNIFVKFISIVFVVIAITLIINLIFLWS